jgi:hypothetical protein
MCQENKKWLLPEVSTLFLNLSVFWELNVDRIPVHVSEVAKPTYMYVGIQSYVIFMSMFMYLFIARIGKYFIGYLGIWRKPTYCTAPRRGENVLM